ncbi:hypothetical protein M2133_000655 [Parabacteroides sp. PF5-6]|nr:hypothetical protein [Parabacteroides sp. PF5-6]
MKILKVFLLITFFPLVILYYFLRFFSTAILGGILGGFLFRE